MEALRFWKAVAEDRTDFLERVIALLQGARVRFCVVGDLAVNAYAEPVVTIDLDIAVAVEDLARAESLLRDVLAAPESDLRINLQRDPRYFAFVDDARPRNVLGLRLPVAKVEDVLRGKVWAAQDPERRASKRQKDLADIARLLEGYPHLRSLVPQEILSRLI